MAEELQLTLNRSLQHVVSICETTAEKVESSQENLLKTLESLESRVQGISELSQQLEDPKISAACQVIEKSKLRFQRVKEKVDKLKNRINKIEADLSQL